jgi:hypothetical protein
VPDATLDEQAKRWLSTSSTAPMTTTTYPSIENDIPHHPTRSVDNSQLSPHCT